MDYFRLIEEKYGIKKDFFDRFEYEFKGRKLWIFIKGLKEFKSKNLISKGLAAFRINKTKTGKIIIKPTTNFIQLFGNVFKDKIVSLENYEEVKLFLNGKDLDLNKEYPEYSEEYVVVKYNNGGFEHYLGCGYIRGNKLLNYIPKDRRIKIEE